MQLTLLYDNVDGHVCHTHGHTKKKKTNNLRILVVTNTVILSHYDDSHAFQYSKYQSFMDRVN